MACLSKVVIVQALTVLLLCALSPLYAQQKNVDFFIDDTLLLLRQKEIQIQATIERLSIDQAVAEEKWQKARSAISSILMANDSAGYSDSKSTAYWQHLKTIRIETENAKLYSEYLRRQAFLRKALLRKDRDVTGHKNYWKTVSDSALLFSEKLSSELQWFEERMAESRLELQALLLSLKETPDSTGKENQRWMRYRVEYLKRLITSDSIMSVVSQQEFSPLFTHYHTVFIDSLKSVPQGQRLKDVARGLKNIWQFEFRSVDGKSVTLGKIIIAVLFIIIGTRVAQVFSKFVANIIAKKTSIDIGIIDASQKLFFYCFTVVFAIYALYLVQVPLTAFTLMGGALALGLGFGSQNILSNFISGIILLIERPVKTGDIIEIESSIGAVETIGLRSIRIRTPGNEHLVIPNSYLLEKPLVNWTLSDKIIRLELTVGVVYGSPIREVKRMLLAAASNIERINSKPEPVVLFSDFGDNALVFNLVFWSKIGTIVDKRLILSQLRFKVMDLFTQAGIVIAFPQRDVHLDSEKPLRLVLERSSSSEAKPK